MADSVANLLLRIKGDPTDAKRALREVAAEVRVFSSQEARARIEIDGGAAANAELERLEGALTLIGQRKVTAKVQVDVDSARARLTLLRKELKHALEGGRGARPVEHILTDIGKVGVKVAELGGEFASIGAKAANFFSGLASSAGQAGASVGGSLLSGLVSAASTMGLMVVVGLLLIPVISAIVAVLSALIASLAAAVAGLAVLAVGGLGALIPVLIVAFAAFKRVADVVGVLGQQHKKAAQDAKALKDAHQQQADAARNLAEAQKNASEQLIAARNAERDAVLGVQDAELSLESSRLGEQDAQLRLDRARLAVKGLADEAKAAGPDIANLFQKFKSDNFDPSKRDLALLKKSGVSGTQNDKALDVRQKLLDLAHAQLGVKEAANSTRHATNNLTDAQRTNAEFQAKGVSAYAGYASALKQVADAEKALSQAQDNTAKVRGANAEQLKKYSKGEIDAGKAVRHVIDAFKGFLNPSIKAALGGFTKFLDNIAKLGKDRGLRSAFTEIGQAIGEVFSNFGTLASSDEARSIFKDLAHDGAGLVRVLGKSVFPEFVKLMMRLAQKAAPLLVDLFRSLGTHLHNLNKSAKGSALKKFVDSVVLSFHVWLGLIKSLGKLLIVFFGNAKGSGDGLVKTLTGMVDKLTAFLSHKEGKAAMKKWLHDGITLAGHMKDAFGELFKFMQRILPIATKMVDLAIKAANLVGKVAGGARKATNFIGLTSDGSYQARVDDIKIAAKEERHIKGIAHQFFTAHGKHKQRLYTELLNLAAAYAPDFGISQSEVLARLGVRRRAWGGAIPGTGGFGDHQLIAAEGGEYMIRRSVVAQVGRPFLDSLNSGTGALPQGIGARGRTGGVGHTYQVTLPAQPPAQIPDARHTAVALSRELKRRGG